MLKLFPRVILADKTTELRLSGDELINGTKVTVSVQSMEKYNVPHTDKYRIDEDNRLIARDIVVNGGEAKFSFTPFGEQRHRVYIDTGARKAAFEIYSLKEDLYKLTPLKATRICIPPSRTDCLPPPKRLRHITRRGSIIWL